MPLSALCLCLPATRTWRWGLRDLERAWACRAICLGLFLAVSVLLVANPALKEPAVLIVILAAAFNFLLLSVVIGFDAAARLRESSREAIEGEVEAIKLTIAYSFLLACPGILLNVFGAEPYVPREVMLVPLASFAGYFYFMVRESQKVEGSEKEAEHREKRGEERGFTSSRRSCKLGCGG